LDDMTFFVILFIYNFHMFSNILDRSSKHHRVSTYISKFSNSLHARHKVKCKSVRYWT